MTASLRFPAQRLHDAEPLPPEAVEIHEQRTEGEDGMPRADAEIMIRVRQRNRIARSLHQLRTFIKFVEIDGGLLRRIRNPEVEQVAVRGIDFGMRRKRTDLVQSPVEVTFAARCESLRVEFIR